MKEAYLKSNMAYNRPQIETGFTCRTRHLNNSITWTKMSPTRHPEQVQGSTIAPRTCLGTLFVTIKQLRATRPNKGAINEIWGWKSKEIPLQTSTQPHRATAKAGEHHVPHRRTWGKAGALGLLIQKCHRMHWRFLCPEAVQHTTDHK